MKIGLRTESTAYAVFYSVLSPFFSLIQPYLLDRKLHFPLIDKIFDVFPERLEMWRRAHAHPVHVLHHIALQRFTYLLLLGLCGGELDLPVQLIDFDVSVAGLIEGGGCLRDITVVVDGQDRG